MAHFGDCCDPFMRLRMASNGYEAISLSSPRHPPFLRTRIRIRILPWVPAPSALCVLRPVSLVLCPESLCSTDSSRYLVCSCDCDFYFCFAFAAAAAAGLLAFCLSFPWAFGCRIFGKCLRFEWVQREKLLKIRNNKFVLIKNKFKEL